MPHEKLLAGRAMWSANRDLVRGSGADAESNVHRGKDFIRGMQEGRMYEDSRFREFLPVYPVLVLCFRASSPFYDVSLAALFVEAHSVRTCTRCIAHNGT